MNGTNDKAPSSNPATDAPHWAVVGGGMLGLALAHELSKQGVQVTMLEAAPELGGLASVWQMDDKDQGTVTWDRHYHVTLLSDTRLRTLVEEIGLADELEWVETKTGFYSKGEMYSMSSAIEFLTFPPLKFIEKIRLGTTILRASKITDWKPLENILVADWLRKWSGKGAFEKVWLPLLKAKLGDAYKTTSAAFIWAHTNRMYAARRTGLKKEMFGYIRGGYARLLDRLAQTLSENGVEVRLNSPVAETTSLENGQVQVKLADEQGTTLRFDNVAYTTPSSVIAKTVPQLSADQRQRHLSIDYLGIVCASMLLDRPITEYYVTNIIEEWVPLTAVIEMTTIVDPKELGGRHLVYLPKYAPAGDKVFDRSDEELKEEWLTALEKMHPHFSRDQVAAFKISRVRDVMALPTLNYSEKLPAMDTGVPGVFAVNSAQILKGNLNVNETIQVADQAIEGPLAAALAAGRLPTGSQQKEQASDDADCELITRS